MGPWWKYGISLYWKCFLGSENTLKNQGREMFLDKQTVVFFFPSMLRFRQKSWRDLSKIISRRNGIMNHHKFSSYFFPLSFSQVFFIAQVSPLFQHTYRCIFFHMKSNIFRVNAAHTCTISYLFNHRFIGGSYKTKKIL